MFLKKAFWSDTLTSPSDSQTHPQSPVGELVRSLDNQRLYREVTLALRTGLRDACGEFSFLRVRGLKNILKSLRSVAEADSTINLFCYSQSIPDLQGFTSIITLLFLSLSFNLISIGKSLTYYHVLVRMWRPNQIQTYQNPLYCCYIGMSVLSHVCVEGLLFYFTSFLNPTCEIFVSKFQATSNLFYSNYAISKWNPKATPLIFLFHDILYIFKENPIIFHIYIHS